MRKERSLPVLTRVLGVGAIGLAAACGGAKVAQNEDEIAGQPNIPVTPSVEPFTPPESVLEAEPIPEEDNLFPDPSFESGDWRNNWVINGFVLTEGGYEETPDYLSIDSTEAHSRTSSLRITFPYDLEDEYSQNCAHTTWRFNGTHGFTFNSEIQLPAGFYEIGVWLKASPRIDEAWFGIGGWLSKENSFGLGTWGAHSTNGRTNWPSEWERLSAVFQVSEEIAQPFFRPSFNVDFSPARLPCGSQINIWFDDVFLTPVDQPVGEVHVLKDPLADEKFYKMLQEKTQPLLERARALMPTMESGRARTVGLFLSLTPEDNITRDKRFQGYLQTASAFIAEYDARRTASPGDADTLLSLAKDVCQFVEENFPEEFAKSLQDPSRDKLCIFQE